MQDIDRNKLEETGWTKQTVMDEPRLSELVDFYKELAFDVVCLPMDPNLDSTQCNACFDDPERYKVIYTRKKSVITFVLFPGVGDMLKKEEFSLSFKMGNMADALGALLKTYPELEDEIMDENGESRNSISIFVNDERVLYQQRDTIVIKSGDSITILPNLSGG